MTSSDATVSLTRGRSLDGRVALVTGAAGKLGQAICEEFEACGASVFRVDVHGACDLEADLSTVEGNRAAVDGVVATHGALDILVLNAGVQHMAPIPEFPLEEWDRLIGVMLSGPFYAMQAAWPHLIRALHGRILVTASTSSFAAERFKAAYVAAKHGVAGLVKVAAREGAESGLTVNAVAPGWMFSAMAQGQIADRVRLLGLSEEEVVRRMKADQAADRFVEPAEVAALLTFLAGPAASGITGTCIPVDLGALA